jgi:hypothetical protein
MIRRNLRQRPKARELRTLFITTLNDLVGKPDFPDAHARQLVQMAALPQGWLTRFMVFQLVKSAVFGERNRRKTPALSFEHVPHHLRALYVTAIFAFLWSDTYRCALFGRVVRSLNSWIMDAIQEVKPDVNAHATRSVVNLVNQVQAPKAFARDDDLVCA